MFKTAIFKETYKVKYLLNNKFNTFFFKYFFLIYTIPLNFIFKKNRLLILKNTQKTILHEQYDIFKMQIRKIKNKMYNRK